MKIYEPHLFNYCVTGKINYGVGMATAVWDFNSYHGDVSSYLGLLYSGSVFKKIKRLNKRRQTMMSLLARHVKGWSLISDLSIVEERPLKKSVSPDEELQVMCNYFICKWHLEGFAVQEWDLEEVATSVMCIPAGFYCYQGLKPYRTWVIVNWFLQFPMSYLALLTLFLHCSHWACSDFSSAQGSIWLLLEELGISW